MKTLYTQEQAAVMLGYKNYRSLNKLITNGQLECFKRSGRNGRKLFSESHIENYLRSLKYNDSPVISDLYKLKRKNSR
jgi:hypothetical protein